ncbi:MAG: hypothetical protein H0U74_21490 [Bradymonadaceae bacterium]|nr:hypothetical protein [Lujinxingiaceae bacterium]
MHRRRTIHGLSAAALFAILAGGGCASVGCNANGCSNSDGAKAAEITPELLVGTYRLTGHTRAVGNCEQPSDGPAANDGTLLKIERAQSGEDTVLSYQLCDSTSGCPHDALLERVLQWNPTRRLAAYDLPQASQEPGRFENVCQLVRHQASLEATTDGVRIIHRTFRLSAVLEGDEPCAPAQAEARADSLECVAFEEFVAQRQP